MDDLAALVDDQDFIADLARFAEGILEEKFLRRKYRFDDAAWARLGEDDALIEAIEAEKVRRIRDGSSKREKAQLLVTKAPDVLGTIMMDGNASPKHRIDASKALDQFAGNGPGVALAADRFVITINISGDTGSPADVLHFDKPRAIGPDDSPSDAKPVILAIPAKKTTKSAARKSEDGGSGDLI